MLRRRNGLRRVRCGAEFAATLWGAWFFGRQVSQDFVLGYYPGLPPGAGELPSVMAVVCGKVSEGREAQDSRSGDRRYNFPRTVKCADQNPA
jgi:hypothetical protein